MPASSRNPDSGRLWIVYAVTVVLAGCSLLYELLIAQTLTILVGNTVVWYSLTVGVFLGALGTGALLCAPMYGKRSVWSALYQVQMLLSLLGASAVPLLHIAHSMYAYLQVYYRDTEALVVLLGVSFLITFVLGLLTGFELPLLIRLGNETAGKRSVTNRVLAADYVGSLLAGLVLPLALLPSFELLTIGILVATLNFLIATLVLFRFVPEDGRIAPRALAGAAFAALLVAAYVNLGAIEQYFLKKYYYYHEASNSLATLLLPLPDFPDVSRESSRYQKIDVVRNVKPGFHEALIPTYSTKLREEPDFPRGYYLFLNGDFQFESNFEELYHEWFAHIPLILNGAVPEEVLVLGGGDGLLIRELLKYDQIRRIVHVDIDPKMVEMAMSDPLLVAMNHGALSDPRVEVIVADAFTYSRNSRETFDAIFMDFPYVVDYDLSKLFSREFYTFVRDRMSEDGFMVFDAVGTEGFSHPDEPGGQKMYANNDWPVYWHTLKAAGFGTIVPYVTNLDPDNPKAYEMLLDSGGTPSGDPPGEELLARRRENLRARLTNELYWMQEGLIMARKDSRPMRPVYRDPGVKLHLLDEKRFYLAFALRFPIPDRVDPDRVNSIMRPTIPELSFSWVRLPW